MAINVPVSVIMPVYNSERYLKESIESILRQSFEDFEFIIIDDGSSDASPEIIKEYQKQDARITLYRQPTNSGIVAARNLGLELAKSKYIAFLDSDDISLPNRLKRQYEFMETNPEVGVLGGGADIIDGDDKHISSFSFPETHIMIAWSLCFFSPVINPAAMIRRNLLLEVGGYWSSSGYDTAEDYELWTRLIGKTKFYNFQDSLIKLRKHQTNITKTDIQSTVDYSLIISRDYVEKKLGSHVSLDTIKIFWNVDQSDNSLNADSILERLYQYFLELETISREEIKYIRKDVARRLVQIAFRHPRDPKSLKVFLQAFSFHPVEAAAFLVTLLKKKAREYISH